MKIEEAREVTTALAEAFARLIPQLSRSSPAPDAERLQEMVDAPGTHVLLAVDDDGSILGTLTLVLFRIPTAMRAWIEDVVVDEAASGRGISYDLNRAALELARANGAKTVDLTSRPSRKAANHVYKKLGFEQRETNVYRMVIGSEDGA